MIFVEGLIKINALINFPGETPLEIFVRQNQRKVIALK